MQDQKILKKIQTLESVFWFALLTHAVGLITMAALLMPGMPGGFASDETRIKYIAANAYFWQAGWLPWQLSALSDLLIAFCLFPFKQIPLYLRLLVLLATAAAIYPDQYGQYLWISKGSIVAQEALAKNDLSLYLKFEQPIYMMVCGWAALLYSVLAGIWTLALKPLFSNCGVVASPLFFKFSWSIWILSFACSILFLCSSVVSVPFVVLAIANAIFFPLLILWFAWVIDYLVKQQRPLEEWGRNAAWRLPSTAPWRAVAQLAGQCSVAKRFFETARPIALASDIQAVVYINYLLPAERLLPLVPAHLELQRLGPEGKYALFSVLTFKHNAFGPQSPAGIRQALNIQSIVSNWRIHVSEPKTKLAGIYFVSNVTNNVLVSLGARLMSEGMPMHLASKSELTIADGKYKVCFESGDGSAPDICVELEIDENLQFTAPWSECFSNFQDFLAYCVPQDRAIASQPSLNRISFQEIKLEIPVQDCKPLKGSVESAALSSLVQSAAPLCFAAPSLQFRFNREHYIRIS